MPTTQEIAFDPCWYLHQMNLDRRELLFVRTTAAELSAASFLDQRFKPSSNSTAIVSIDEMLPLMPNKAAELPKYIFHTAFCCSTLLARCLDLKGSSLALKEPQVLMTLANYRRTHHAGLQNPAAARELFKLVSWLLFRRFPSDDGQFQEVIIKPTNTVNNIIQPLLEVDLHSRAILLHSDLESFLISLLKKGEEGRAFGRNLFTIFQMDSAEAQQMAVPQLMRMTDLQIACLTWQLQFEHFISAQQRLSASIKTIHCDRLLDDSEAIIRKTVQHLKIEALDTKLDQVIQQAPLKDNAKTPGQAFTAADRKNEHLETRKEYASSLDIITPWARQLRFKYPFAETLTNKL